jgi:hypothetical protein
MRLLGLNEVRRTVDSWKSESKAKPGVVAKHCRHRGVFSGWRRNVRKHKLMNQGSLSRRWKELGRSQSPHSSDEAGNDRGAKEGRKVDT